MLDGLDRIGWAELKHAYGPATDVPAALRAMALGGASQSARALSALSGSLCHQGSRYTATLAAIPFLAELAFRSGPHTPGLLDLLRDIAAPSCQQILEARQTTQAYYDEMAHQTAHQSHADQIHSDSFGVSPLVDAQCHAAVANALPQLEPLVAAPSCAISAAMMGVLAELPAQGQDSATRIIGVIETASLPALQRAGLQALGRLAQSVETESTDTLLRPWLTPSHPLPVRVEAALSLTACDAGCRDLLGQALHNSAVLYQTDTVDRDVFAPPGWTADRVALCLSRWRATERQRAETVAAILAALPPAKEAGVATSGLVRALLACLAEGAPIEGLFRGRGRSRLTALDRQVLKAIATHGDWTIGDTRNDNFARLMHRCGLPDTAQGMTRFATRPGPLTRLLRR